MWQMSIALIVCFRLIVAQNDDHKNDEWSADDPRWNTKIPNWWDEEHFVPPVGPIAERSEEFWVNQGQTLLAKKVRQKLNENKAKNVIIFIGDGMGLATLMATRSYINDVNYELSFEKFQHTGLAKTYCINYQVPDSSCTATAILSGVKNNYGTIGVNGHVNLRNCTALRDNSTRVNSIFKYAQDAGKATGVVTTTRITHATPAASYAHTASRYWESNEGVQDGCEDIALQLIHGDVGSKLDVAMGGGKNNFLPVSDGGYRTDKRNLIDEYLNVQRIKNQKAQVVKNSNELQAVNISETDKLLGLFASSHMEYKLLADTSMQPTITEMTAKALEMLKKNENGFVMLIEGGRIDTAHHDTKARLALEEAVEFQKAVQYVKDNTNEDDTLIVVTADHSTVLTVGGYMPRGFNILGPGDFSRTDQMWFYSLSYASGPGYADHVKLTGGRQNPQGKKYMDPQFRQPATIPEDEQTHGGEDVPVYANGPFSHIFTGVYEQNYIAHAVMFASCLGPEDHLKRCAAAAASTRNTCFMTLGLIVLSFSARYQIHTIE